MAKPEENKEHKFLAMTDAYKSVIAKVCYLYVSPGASFEDLYQEVLINIWQGMDGFRGDSKISTWIYRTAINTCITWHRKNDKHVKANSLEDLQTEPIDISDAGFSIEDYKMLQLLITNLLPLEKALITMWLDDKPYDEIAEVTGLSRSNVAVKIHRIKEKLAKMATD